jgi:hypothetical protein
MKVTSNDGTEFELSLQAVQHSALMNECDGDDAFPLLMVSTEYTRYISDILNFIASNGMPDVNAALKSPSQLGPLFDMLPCTNSGLVELYRAARYILCDDLIKLVCAKLAYNTRHLSPPNIRIQVQDIRESYLLPFIPELAKVEPTHLMNSVERFAWLLESGYILDRRSTTCMDIVKHCEPGDTIEVLKLARQRGCSWDTWVCERAAAKGHINTLKWLRDNGCPWNERTCESAAREGHFDTLKWARNNGCPCDEWVCAFAAEEGRLDILQWARENV